MEVGRGHPHAYALMFGEHAGSLAAVSRTHDQFLAIVTEFTGDAQRARPIGALLMTSVHGIIAMENNGQLTAEKWHTTGDELLRMLIDRIGAAGPDGAAGPG